MNTALLTPILASRDPCWIYDTENYEIMNLGRFKLLVLLYFATIATKASQKKETKTVNADFCKNVTQLVLATPYPRILIVHSHPALDSTGNTTAGTLSQGIRWPARMRIIMQFTLW